MPKQENISACLLNGRERRKIDTTATFGNSNPTGQICTVVRFLENPFSDVVNFPYVVRSEPILSMFARGDDERGSLLKPSDNQRDNKFCASANCAINRDNRAGAERYDVNGGARR